jgi:cytochrome c biogenesis protein CcdA/glutaredoxin
LRTLTHKSWFIVGLIVAMSFLVTPFAQAQTEKPVVRGYLFYSQTCPACHQTRLEVLPPLYKEFGQQLQIMAIDITADEANYQWYLECQKQYSVPGEQSEIPALFIGDQYLIGTQDIQEQLPELIKKHLDAGGIDYPNVPRPGGPYKPRVRFMFFYSASCPHCQDVEENVFPAIRERYGDQVQWESYDRSDLTNYQALLILDEMAGMPQDSQGAVPQLFIGDDYSLYTLLLGSTDIKSYLIPAIEWFMAIGGVDYPEWKDQLFELASTPFPTPTPGTPQAATTTPQPTAVQTLTSTVPSSTEPSGENPSIHMAYFAELGCSECDAVSTALVHLQDRFPSLVIHEFDIIDDLSLNLCLSERLGVPPDQRHDAPAIFVGEHYLVGKDISYEKLIEIVSLYAETGAEPSWETCAEETVTLPPPPPWWAVILPGLADGINPCAFATIIFFVSYLSIIHRKGRDILMVGMAFTLAVFLSYLGFGMLLREIFATLIDLVGPVLRPILNGLTALLCLALAVLSFADFRKAQRGNVKDMALQLPHKLRMWINATIRQSMRSETLVTASFVSGVIVSFIELACTGQVYVPIVQGLSNPQYRAQSTMDLLVYCLAFIIPLIVVFILSYMGTSSKQLTQFFNRYAAPVKLVMMLLFLGIGLWLVYDILRVWGVIAPMFAAASL